jgi:serine/threonine protein kinase
MTPERWHQVTSIFHAARTRDAAEREVFLAEACRGDASLREDVDAMLAADAGAGSFGGRPLFASGVSFEAGTMFGAYRIEQLIGRGGMGEVYRARDTRLDRLVALKILHEHLTGNPERQTRFEREARLLSRLNHPHICTLYDVGEHEGSTYLVLELLNGETLAERLERSQPDALPLKDALAIAVDVAEALEAAHQRGVVHRDVKPSNIMLTPAGAKLLDFGISKAVLEGTGWQTSTVEGRILGTVPYMAPEQLEGRDADMRSDIFSSGAVLYEMVTGRRAFVGESQAGVIAAILDSEPPPITSNRRFGRSHKRAGQAAVRRQLRTVEHIVGGCLAKNPNDRWQSATELMDQLKAISERSSFQLREELLPSWLSGRPEQRLTMWVLAGVTVTAVALIAVLATSVIRHATLASSATRFDILTPATRDLTSIALSPDGQQLAFTGDSDGVSMLWLRRLDKSVSRPLPDTEGAYAPFWAPDDSEIGFFAGGKLRRIDVASGYVQVIADAPSGRGGAWSPDGTIVFAPVATAGLMRVAAVGGTPVPLIDGGPGRGTPRWPQFLPDGRRFLFYRAALPELGIRGVYVGSLDGTPPRRIIDASGSATFVPPHWLFFESYGSLRAQYFDPERVVVSGQPIPVADDVAIDGNVLRDSFTGSADRAFAYRTSDRHYRSDLLWRDRSGRVLGKLGSFEGIPPAPTLSPDGQLVALARRVQGSDNIWIVPVNGGRPVRLTSDPPGSNARVTSERNPIWSPDGRRIVFASARKPGAGTTDLYERPLARGDDRLILETSEFKYAQSWSRDGRFLLYSKFSTQSGLDIWALPLDGSHPPFAVAQSPAAEDLGQFSPDGRWVAYQSNESGQRFEIYVQSFPSPTTKMKVSVGGGVQPRWSYDGRELFYVAPDGRMTSVPVATQPHGGLIPGTPTALFAARLVQNDNSIGREIPHYDVARDGRFLLVSPPGDAIPPSIHVLLNWKAPR